MGSRLAFISRVALKGAWMGVLQNYYSQIANGAHMQFERESQERLRRSLDILCAIVADATGASSVLVAKRNPRRKTIQVRGSIGTMVKELDMSFAIPSLDAVKSPTISIPDVRLDPRFVNHPMIKLAPHIRSFIAIMLPGFEQNERAVLHIVNPKRTVFGDAAIWRELSNFTTLFAEILGLEGGALANPLPLDSDGDSQISFFESKIPPLLQQPTALVPNTDSKNSGIDFLFDTLIKKRTLHSRNGMDYLTLRSWRSQLKSYQISTLISLKQTKPDALVRRCADEIIECVRHVYGDGVITAVVPIPAGSSGDPDSFSVMLAREIATDLNVAFCDILVPQGSRGKSAPIKSAKLKPYVLKEAVSGPILVVDDVASSGAHMERAISALKHNSKAVYGVAWIGK
jgi:hypoxanthine-guanine phosphoribosyltransferase